jgi:hypothetical protein
MVVVCTSSNLTVQGGAYVEGLPEPTRHDMESVLGQPASLLFCLVVYESLGSFFGGY